MVVPKKLMACAALAAVPPALGAGFHPTQEKMGTLTGFDEGRSGMIGSRRRENRSKNGDRPGDAARKPAPRRQRGALPG